MNREDIIRALKALENAESWLPKPYSTEARCAIIALRAALAEPVQEPVAWMRVIDEAMVTHHLGVAEPADDYETAKRKMNNLLCCAQDIGAYFATPPQRKPLTEEDIQAAWDSVDMRHPRGNETRIAFARAIESKLQEKNT